MNFDDMTMEELIALYEKAQRELAERQTREAVDREVAKVITDYREGSDVPAPVPGAKFVQPKGASDSYVKGETVNVAGKLYESTLSCNMCAPEGDCTHAAWKPVE